MKISDDLDTRLRAAAAGNVSQWVTEAIQDRLDRDMWNASKEVDALLGITEDWMAERIRLRDRVRSADSR